MEQDLANTVAMVGVIAALVQQFKRVKILTRLQDHVPIYVIISVLLGIGAAYYIQADNAIIEGVMMGLTACGAYSASKQARNGEPITS